MTRIPLSTTVTGSGPGLLLAHGAGASIESNFLALLPTLARCHTVVAPNYPGSGATPRSEEPLTIDGLADAIVGSATAAGVERFTVLGYSMGTLVAIRAAARHPDRVRGLVLTAGLPGPDNRVLASLDLSRKLLAEGDRKAYARFVAMTYFSRQFFNSVPRSQLKTFYGLIARAIPAGAPEQSGAVAEADVTGDLPGISVPTLVIGATLDNLVSPENSLFLAARIPGAEYTEIEAGHVVMMERPDEWQKLTLDFLARHGL
ncbi:alpha/beta fold hydrolase [Streptomyces orinoci]|uniref:Alpha/beta hydrolase n=1 Tax=Streptomyces orinoci TaxID=67339 RepID=A0ABV3JU90_STRON|nr:alpha/beta hydrolase [Streptomyces orinoci]